MRRHLLILILCLGSVPCPMSASPLALIPWPASVERLDGEFRAAPDTRLLFAARDAELREALPVASDLLHRLCGDDVVVGETAAPRDGAVFLGRLASEAEPEVYTLEITPRRVVLLAGGPAGLRHGLATLEQLLPTAFSTPGAARPAGGWTLPGVRIADRPRLAQRGVMLDCCRHFMSVPFLEQVLDLMARYKLNRFHWHLTEDQAWRLQIRRYPRLTDMGAWRIEPDETRHGGFYTQDEARHIVRYAAARGITVVPEIELPGHCRAALAAYPELSCTGETQDVPCTWGVFEDVYCAGNDEVFAFLTGVLTEVLAIFPSPEIHIGGDEVPKSRWRACPRCQARMAAEGLADEDALQSWFVRRVGEWLAAHDRRLVGWDEILEGGPLPAGAVVQSWRGLDGALAAARAGHDVIVSPTSHCYLDYDVGVTDLATCFAFEPVPAELTAAEARHVRGGEMNLWTEYAPEAVALTKLLPRLLALAEVFWSPAGEARDFTHFWRRAHDHRLRLNARGLRLGAAARPLRLTAGWDDDAGGWRLTSEITTTVPDGERTIRLGRGDFAPDSRDRVLDGEALVTASGPVAAQLFVDGIPYGAAARCELAHSHALECAVALDPAPSAKYPPRLAHPLTDGVLGSRNFRDGTWLAWEGRERVTAIVDLGEIRPVREVRATFLQDANSWIWLPLAVVVAVSIDGEAYTGIGGDRCRTASKEQTKLTQDFEAVAAEAVPARYVKLEVTARPACPAWHPGAGGEAWVFWGQVVVE